MFQLLSVLSAGTPVIITPKRKLPMESGQSYGFSNKKRRSIKKNLGMELFPSSFFGGGSTPGSGANVFYVMLSAVVKALFAVKHLK